MECVKSADILKPAKSAAKGLMAVISGDKGGYVRVKGCVVSSPDLIRHIYCFWYNVQGYWKQSVLGLVLGLGLRLGTELIKLSVVD